MSQESSTLKIENITEKDSDEVLKFSMEYFVKDEPLSKSVGLLYCDEIKESILSAIPDHCSFKVVKENNVIVGLVLSRLKKRPIQGEVEKEKVKKEPLNEKWNKIARVLDYCDQQWNIFDLYPNADVIMDGKIIAVDPEYRGLGIAGKLIQKCKDYMREHNIQVMRRVCTSHFSARVMEKMGMKEVYKLIYEDFKVNGAVFVKPAPPHVACRSFVMEV